MSKEVYFENVVSIGDLSLEHIFVEFEGEPILFLCTDENDNMYLCLCSDFRDEQRWVVAYTNLSIINSLIQKEVDLVTALTANPITYMITRDCNSIERSERINTENIDELDLPRKGTLLRCDVNSAIMYLSKKYSEMIIQTYTDSSCNILKDIFYSAEISICSDIMSMATDHVTVDYNEKYGSKYALETDTVYVDCSTDEDCLKDDLILAA